MAGSKKRSRAASEFTFASPALLIAGVRTGGTFLSVALSNHPQIFCARGEPFHRRSLWKSAIPDEAARLELLWNQQGYVISMFKISVADVRKPSRWSAIKGRLKIKILSLTRENSLEQAASNEINRMHCSGKLRSHPAHSFDEVNPAPVVLGVGSFIKEYKRAIGAKKRTRKMLGNLSNPVLYLTYEQITRGGKGEVTQIPEEASKRICKFLGVDLLPLSSQLRKIHKRPYEEIVTNWREILGAMK